MHARLGRRYTSVDDDHHIECRDLQSKAIALLALGRHRAKYVVDPKAVETVIHVCLVFVSFSRQKRIDGSFVS